MTVDSSAQRAQPLKGITILDFTWSVAGPTMTRYLGGLGARILKVEWPKGPDPMRTAMFHKDTQEMNYNNGVFFGNLNIGKESVVLNVKDQLGKDVIRDLISSVDVVTESFSSSVMRSWGFSYESMRELNPRIIYASISGFGHNGPHAAKNTWGPTAQAMSGMTAASGVSGRDPAGWGYSYLDVTAGYMGAIGVMAALRNVQKTGEGARLDLSQVETGLSLVGPALTDYLTNGVTPPETYPGGNRSTDDLGRDTGFRGDASPLSDVFRTKGGQDNDWIAVTVTTNEQWRSLTEIADPHLNSFRELHLDDVRSKMTIVTSHLAEFFQSLNKYKAAEILSDAGIAAGPVQGGRDRVEIDPQLAQRGFLREYQHPTLEHLRVQELPIVSPNGHLDWRFEPKFPVLGADTKTVLKEILDYSDQRIEELESAGVLWPDDVPKEMTIERSLW